MFNWETIENSLSLYTFVHIVERNQTDWTNFVNLEIQKHNKLQKKGLFYEIYYVFINI